MSQEQTVKIPDGLFEETLAAAYAPVVTISELIKNSSDACTEKKDIIRVDIDTKKSLIKIKDNGCGFSKKDIENLGNVGMSQKMFSENIISKIGEPYAGSKGLGILTAFNLCNNLEVLTHSEDDKCTHYMSWTKGTQKIIFAESDVEIKGTELTLIGVSPENIRLITMDDELQKLYSSSILYYVDSQTLPTIEIYEDGIRKERPQKIKIDPLYHKYRMFRGKYKGQFVAKGVFKYSVNKLTLSYEDNIKNLFNFQNEEIDLTDSDSLHSFLYKHNIDFKSVVFRSSQEMCKNYDSLTSLDDFSGIYYIWRERKEDDLNYSCGIRVYVNNYGLYDYLDTENDWLLHSEVSQNIRYTNYKLKNTFGYVRFDNYNESNSSLKISKARNDFIVNLAKKKFLYIMQGFVSGIFSSIDITLKDKKYNAYVFQLRYENRKILPGGVFNIRDLIQTTLPIDQIEIQHDSEISINSETGDVTASQVGQHKIKFSDGLKWLEFTVTVEDPTPNFELSQSIIKRHQGETIDLRNNINKSSIVNIRLEDINVRSDDAVLKNFIFSEQNFPGEYTVQYFYEIEGEIQISRMLKVKIEPLYATVTNKFRKIFPNYKLLSDFLKIKDIIEGMANCYAQYPTICIISLRTLIEVSIRAFLGGVCGEQVQKSMAIDQGIAGVCDRLKKDNPNIDTSVSAKYKDRLTKDRAQKRLIKDYQKLDLNCYVHDEDALPTSDGVLQATKQFSFFLNFIIEALVASQKAKATHS